jgi:hypothetical protein
MLNEAEWYCQRAMCDLSGSLGFLFLEGVLGYPENPYPD